MSSTTPNLGLTKTTAAETIGQNWAASNDSGGNFDIIDTKMGAVGSTPVQAQLDALNSKMAYVGYVAPISWEPTGSEASVTSGTAVNIAVVSELIPSGATARGVIMYSAYGSGNYDYAGTLMLIGGNVKYMPRYTQGSIHVYGALIYTK